MARLRPTEGAGRQHYKQLVQLVRKISDDLGFDVPAVAGSESVVLRASAQKLALYEVSYNALYTEISRICSGNEIFLIVDNNDFIPVIMGSERLSIDRAIDQAQVSNKRNVLVPVRELLDFAGDVDLKSIVAGREGEFYPLPLPTQNLNETMNNVRQSVTDDKGFEVSFSGSYFSNKLMMKQMLIVLLISLALLYFILASQFESLTLPIIVLLEVPIDLFGAFLFLWIWGGGINLMSLIGIIVMSGIIINDSILKVDTINQLRSQGFGLLRALSEAGKRRLKPILMTSITTILALVPFLFTGGLGSDLQRPLALAVIGGMLVGTVVSLYFIPLCYYVLEYRAELKKRSKK
jgi:multidrug efflux pump subunit AcrB